MNNAHLEGEIKAFYGDIKTTEDILSYERKNLAEQLKNGLGDEIKEYLNNPPDIKKTSSMKIKLKRWINKLLNKKHS